MSSNLTVEQLTLLIAWRQGHPTRGQWSPAERAKFLRLLGLTGTETSLVDLWRDVSDEGRRMIQQEV